MSQPPEPPARRRADAQRNRDKIVATAHQAFIRHGIGVPMEEIARRAEVGVGTLYRHFGDREALLRAVVATAIDNLITLSRKETDHESDPWGALCRFMRRCVELRLGAPLSALRPRLKDAVMEIPEVAHATSTMLDMLDPLVAGAQARGDMRDDVGTGDVLGMLAMLVRHETEIAEDHKWVAMRHLEIVLDGLRARSDSPLPGHPMDGTDPPTWHASRVR
ncbi:TetR/AcrR family transcriptional regulator [Phytomonospora endophytica]|uniref:AcrR family transcriptional regulator n=1 Tax=Phytomonospora endophytica TaxID=714109 RepID=A0A841FPJ6_9ACTN|nr:TetR/AcrR family transcriptional regulator [Phytomonospora endophytica]MBB6035177.1 AcrR family transcriptional regulator [Phytomonospora endophytica]GIG64074.1 TetR family transcriptional regulator [Phytomonospora endophytica]